MKIEKDTHTHTVFGACANDAQNNSSYKKLCNAVTHVVEISHAIQTKISIYTHFEAIKLVNIALWLACVGCNAISPSIALLFFRLSI